MPPEGCGKVLVLCELAGVYDKLIAARVLKRRCVARLLRRLPVFTQIPPRLRRHCRCVRQFFPVRLCHLNALCRYFIFQLLPADRNTVVPLVQLPAQLFAELAFVHLEDDIPLGDVAVLPYFRYHKRVFAVLLLPACVQHLQAAYFYRLPHSRFRQPEIQLAVRVDDIGKAVFRLQRHAADTHMKVYYLAALQLRVVVQVYFHHCQLFSAGALYARALEAQTVHAAAIFSYGERAARDNHFAA